MSLHSETRRVKNVAIAVYKRCSVRLDLQLFVGSFTSYLRYLCLLAHSDVQQILCYVFIFIFVVVVLLNLCYQFV